MIVNRPVFVEVRASTSCPICDQEIVASKFLGHTDDADSTVGDALEVLQYGLAGHAAEHSPPVRTGGEDSLMA